MGGGINTGWGVESTRGGGGGIHPEPFFQHYSETRKDFLLTFFIGKWEFKNDSFEKNFFLDSDFRNGISDY